MRAFIGTLAFIGYVAFATAAREAEQPWLSLGAAGLCMAVTTAMMISDINRTSGMR